MKLRAFSVFLLVLMSAQLILPALPVVDYLINQDYIAKNLCVNKDVPKSCCKGKCHLVKQLNKTNNEPEKAAKNTNPRVKVKEINDFLISKSIDCIKSELKIGFIIHLHTSLLARSPEVVFIPPEV